MRRGRRERRKGERREGGIAAAVAERESSCRLLEDSCCCKVMKVVDVEGKKARRDGGRWRCNDCANLDLILAMFTTGSVLSSHRAAAHTRG